MPAQTVIGISLRILAKKGHPNTTAGSCHPHPPRILIRGQCINTHIVGMNVSQSGCCAKNLITAQIKYLKQAVVFQHTAIGCCIKPINRICSCRIIFEIFGVYNATFRKRGCYGLIGLHVHSSSSQIRVGYISGPDVKLPATVRDCADGDYFALSIVVVTHRGYR